MDDYDTLINSEDGSHCLIFLNQPTLEETEIRNIFSEFGYIHNLRYHKNKSGHWFVRYRSKDDAKFAVDNLKNHPKIKLSEHHKKKKTDHHVSDKSQNNGHRHQASDGQRFGHKFNKQNNKKTEKSRSNRNGNDNENECNSNFNNNLPWDPKSPNGNQNNQVQKSNGCKENYDGPPDLVDRNKKIIIEEKNQEDKIPDLVTSNGNTLKTSIPMKKVLHAQEVIVANIHPKFGAPYILHLFDRFEPLAITNIMMEPKTAKRYCHVYFKSTEDSEQVESFFNEISLLDQKLVVKRFSQLA